MTHTYDTAVHGNEVLRVRASREENGVEVCNTCCNPADRPYRWKDGEGRTFGCTSACHDVHVRTNKAPSWMAPRWVLPAFVVEARRAQAKRVAEAKRRAS